jgi:mono/diheme cytochrome c family protein
MNAGNSESDPSTPRVTPSSPGSARARVQLSTSPARATALPRRSSGWKRAIRVVFKGVANLVFIGSTIYLTYFFTMFFSTHKAAPPPVPEAARAAAKKTEELRAEERRQLNRYGPVNPVTKAVHIPIDRAMELMAAEASRPAAPTTAAQKKAPLAPSAVAGSIAAAAEAPPAPGPAPTNAQAPAAAAVATASAPAPASAGMPAEQLYRAICITCHDVDGKGKLVRAAMPAIPDLTDAKWQASRTDAELSHSILEGKGQLMLPMKDKFALARTDVKDMIALMRSFQSGKQLVAAGAPAQASPLVAALTAGAPPTTPSSVLPTLAPTPSASIAAAPTGLLPAAASPPPPVSGLGRGTQPAAPSFTALTPLPPGSRSPAAKASPARAQQLKVAAEFYRNNCIACHGPDGRGTPIRPAMPSIPDFTSGPWQSSRESPQLSVAILEGKGALMPPWRGRMAPELARDLAEFVRTFGPPGLLASAAPKTAFGTRVRELQKRWDELNIQLQALSRP